MFGGAYAINDNPQRSNELGAKTEPPYMPHIYTWKDADLHNPHMLSYLIRDMTHNPDSKLGMGTGWSGAKTLLTEDKFKPLQSFIRSKLPLDGSLSGWGNILRPGELIGEHNHCNPAAPADNNLAGVYYLTPGVLSLSGGGKFHMEPGQMILFKANQLHSVPPTNQKIRVSVAFNVRF